MRTTLDVFSAQEGRESRFEVLAAYRLSSADLTSLDGLPARIIQRKRLACADRMGPGVALSVFVAPAAIPFRSTPKRPKGRIRHGIILAFPSGDWLANIESSRG